MTDLDMTHLCAVKMNLPNIEAGASVVFYTNAMSGWPRAYDPLHDDGQMTGLVKAFGLSVLCYTDDIGGKEWIVSQGTQALIADYNLNRAVVKCVMELFGDKKLAA